MTNKEVANKFNLLAQLMELHGENPFKIKSYAAAYIHIRKQDVAVIDLSKEELIKIQGIGAAIAEKIVELKVSNQIKLLQIYLDKTPQGIVQLLQMKGFGPKKNQSRMGRTRYRITW